MKFECDLIRDLMPLCADDAASEASKKAVQTHIAVCTECAREWDSIRGELTVSADAPPPEPKYADAAKKYRINRLCRLIFCMVTVILLCFGWWVSPLSRGHFTALGAVRAAIQQENRHTLSDLSDYEVVYQYDWKTKDTVTFWIMPRNTPKIYTIDVERGKWNLYYERGGSYKPYDPNQNVVLLDMTGDETEDIFYYGIYAKDSDVHTVRMTFDGKTVSETVDEKRFCALMFHWSEINSLYDIRGEALDADGNLLYTMETTRDKYNNPHYDWIPPQ